MYSYFNMAAYCRPIISICFIKNGRDPNKRTKWILKNSYFYSGFRSRSQNASGHGCPVQGVYQMEIWGGFFFCLCVVVACTCATQEVGMEEGWGKEGRAVNHLLLQKWCLSAFPFSFPLPLHSPHPVIVYKSISTLYVWDCIHLDAFSSLPRDTFFPKTSERRTCAYVLVLCR